jgi:hypothetical protein
MICSGSGTTTRTSRAVARPNAAREPGGPCMAVQDLDSVRVARSNAGHERPRAGRSLAYVTCPYTGTGSAGAPLT